MARLDFSNFFAFLLPGFVAFYSLVPVSSRASELVAAIVSNDASAGVMLVVVLFSLAAGVVIGAFRSQVLDEIQFQTGVNRPGHENPKRSNEPALPAFDEANADTCRVTQFYGNMLIATFMLLAGTVYAGGDLQNKWLAYLILILTVSVLFLAHRKQLTQTCRNAGPVPS